MTSADIHIRIGGVYVSEQPAIIRTTLGSCIAACLYDPVARIGGMNHFMLPELSEYSSEGDLGRFGLHSMELLMGAMQRAGAHRARVVAKVFGGGHVLGTDPSELSVAARNVSFIERYVVEEKIPVVAQDLGGFLPRRVHFYTDTGKAMVKRLGSTAIKQVSVEEGRARKAPTHPTTSDVVLFDP
jgi:chemotaxis receptor (MCP) glutamine deamidase CheD